MNLVYGVFGRACLFGASLFFAGQLHADEPELLMRSGATSAFQIPVGSSWSSATPSLNDQRQVALHINAVAPSQHAGIWKGSPEGGGIVATAPDSNTLYSDTGMNDQGNIVWRRAESSTNGVMKYDADSDTFALLTNAPLGANSWTSLQINDADRVAYRAGFSGGNAWVSFSAGSASIHLAETGIDSNSDWAFLFSPALNIHGQLAGKAAFENFNQNRIILTDASGLIEILVDDNDLDPASPFSNFDNSIGFNDVGQVAFIASLVGGGRALYLADSDGWVELARQGEGELGDFEFFRPVLNNHGVVAFRAFNAEGQRAIWRANIDGLTAVAMAGDIVETDLGPARLESPTTVGGPNFGGSPAINNLGDIAFVSLLTDPDNPGISYGRGVFLVAGSELVSDDLFQDRFEANETP